MMVLQSAEVAGQAWEEITRQLLLMVFQSVCVVGPGSQSSKEAVGPVALAELHSKYEICHMSKHWPRRQSPCSQNSAHQLLHFQYLWFL